MIVMAIIGILAAIAIPSYLSYIQRSRKSEARVNLTALAVGVEEYNSLYGRYCPACVAGAGPITLTYTEDSAGASTADTLTNWLDFRPKQASASGAVAYNYQLVATFNTAYTLTATPVANRGVPMTGAITLNQTGAKADGARNGW